MEPIVLPLIDARSEAGVPSPRTLQGVRVIEQEHKGRKWDKHPLPEFGRPRHYGPTLSRATEVARPPEERRDKIPLKTEADGLGIPAGGKIAFVPAEKAETPYSLKEVGTARVIAFRQPRFLHGTVTPSLSGRCASNLLSLRTGWGDSGP